MVADAQQFVSAVIRMVTAGGVLSVLNPLMLPLLLLAVLPAGVGAVLSARVDYEIHYGNIADRNVRGMMRWWATESKYSDEVRANSMVDYLVYWYRALSDRCDRRTLAAAPRTLRIALLSALAGGICLAATWGALAWLAVSGRIDLAVAATAVIAVQTMLAALTQVVTGGAAVFHTSLYLGDMQSFLDEAADRAPQRGPCRLAAPVEEIRLEEVVYQYPGKDKPAVDGVSLTLRRGQILAIVGANGSGKSTLTRLLTGIYLADKGTVSWNGTDLADADPASVWRLTGLVPQIFGQWPLRLRENVTLGQPRSSDDAPVWEAVDAVGLRDAVEDLPRVSTPSSPGTCGAARSCPAVSGSASRVPGPCTAGPNCSSSTSPPPRWTPGRTPDLRTDQGHRRRPHHHRGHPPPGEHQDRGPHHRDGARPDHRAGPVLRPRPRRRNLRRTPGTLPGPLTDLTAPPCRAPPGGQATSRRTHALVPATSATCDLRSSYASHPSARCTA